MLTITATSPFSQVFGARRGPLRRACTRPLLEFKAATLLAIVVTVAVDASLKNWEGWLWDESRQRWQRAYC
ncbi:uncharacterized protein ARMOST_21155 [Armillaria ostoyae]|uniref:Uncharacterized protein n=1 Tax=Armillaria ostoyae TaxID=47428 RepID=A0A284S9D3_ARMOS|nr:uncharacterized protein ARMOST_21155 [Armillaria ostoyae]